MSETPTILWDFEFQFTSGQALFVTAEEGRDVIAVDTRRVRLELHPDAQTTEEVLVRRRTLAYMRSTRREVVADPTFEEVVEQQLAGGERAH